MKLQRSFSAAWASPYFWSLVGVVLGLLFLIVSHLITAETDTFVESFLAALNDVGIAFLIAAFLATTFELVFHRALVEDAFKASIGYLLPDELKAEMNWIYTQGLICVEHAQEYELLSSNSPEPDTVVMHVKLFRTFRNIASQTHSFERSLAIDEWHRAEPSEILEIGHEIGGVQHVTQGSDLKLIRKENALVTDPAQPEVIQIPPGGELKVWIDFRETKRMNDSSYMVFRYPTVNPTVVVKRIFGDTDSSIDFKVDFGHRQQHAVMPMAGDHFRLQGTLLPNQHIQIRWWKRADAKKWLNGNAE